MQPYCLMDSMRNRFVLYYILAKQAPWHVSHGSTHSMLAQALITK